jgi:Family of unknown function (DUF6325)
VIGPVQVLVVGFDRPTFSGEVLAELSRLGKAGIVRLVDLLLVSRADDGSLQTADLPDEVRSEISSVTAELLGQPVTEPSDEDDQVDGAHEMALEPGTTWSLAEAVPAGGTAAVALIEHIWASPLRAAVQQSGGTLLEETWLAPDDLLRLDELISRRTSG